MVDASTSGCGMIPFPSWTWPLCPTLLCTEWNPELIEMLSYKSRAWGHLLCFQNGLAMTGNASTESTQSILFVTLKTCLWSTYPLWEQAGPVGDQGGRKEAIYPSEKSHHHAGRPTDHFTWLGTQTASLLSLFILRWIKLKETSVEQLTLQIYEILWGKARFYKQVFPAQVILPSSSADKLKWIFLP